MQLPFIAVLSLAVSAVLFLVAFFEYPNIRGIHSVVQRMLKLRSERTRARSITETGCRG
jgi:hypothetical protein